jgi:hypothetical protein
MTVEDDMTKACMKALFRALLGFLVGAVFVFAFAGILFYGGCAGTDGVVPVASQTEVARFASAVGPATLGSSKAAPGVAGGSGAAPGSISGGKPPPDSSWVNAIPREPMWLINAGNGTRSQSDPNGLATWWHDDNPAAVDEFIGQIRKGYALGARRFFVNRPMGSNGATHVPAASWLTIPESKRSKLVSALVDLQLDPSVDPIHIIWFIGSDLSDPRDINGWRPDGRTFYSIGESGSYERQIATRATLGGWISTGASGLAIDHSAPIAERQHFIDLAASLRGEPFNLQIMGEAFPVKITPAGAWVKHNTGPPELDSDAIESMSWVITTVNLRKPFNWPYGSKTETYPPNPKTTRLYVWFDYSLQWYGETELDQRGYVRQVMRENLIPITSEPVLFDEALKIYRSVSGG